MSISRARRSVVILSIAIAWTAVIGLVPAVRAQVPVPESIEADGVPPVPSELQADVARYLEFRTAGFRGWRPGSRSVLIATRFADAPQLHLVARPGGDRKQLTFDREPISRARFSPTDADTLIYAKDKGGDEFYQLYRFDLADGKSTLLTDGKSRNTDARWSHDGRLVAYSSTRRTGRDTDIWIVDPKHPETDRLAVKAMGGGWEVADWSEDGKKLLLLEFISANESYLHLADVATGDTRLLTPKIAGQQVFFGDARFDRAGKGIYLATDRGSEFRRLVHLDIATGAEQPVGPELKWDVDDIEVSEDGSRLALVANENGVGVLHLIDTRTGRELPRPKVPVGIISSLAFSRDGRELGFALSSARSPSDVYSLELGTGHVTRWTESETGGVPAQRFAEPEAVTVKSFDGLPVSGFLYRPDPGRFAGKRPVIMVIHGGPEGQSRPGFLGRNNYLIDELGIALFFPNVRGSEGYGKTFLALDNGVKREDSVKDIGAFLDRLGGDPTLDGDRIAVYGGSYGGYMVLASMEHFADRLRCGLDVVGISNFLTFLKNTQEYRRDLRRVEYGDERDPEMAGFLERISPTANVAKIKSPLFIVAGRNDPRVPASEAEQMVKAIRDQAGTAWYVIAKDEGHGFQKKLNADYQFLTAALFFRQYLLN
jgi:dipeptidyl aminopeptidase/acylaminoacyl peptidase